MEFSDVLIYLTGGQEPITTVDELALHMGKTRETVYGYRKGHQEPPVSSVRSLHRWLVKEKGCHIVTKYMNPELSAEVNGTVQDDFWMIHEQSTDAARYYQRAKKGNPTAKQKYFDELHKMEKELKDLKAEGEQL